MFPFDFELIGTVTNPKYFAVCNKLELWDAMDMVSPMSLESFCKSMMVKGKMDGTDMFRINTLYDWYEVKL